MVETSTQAMATIGKTKAPISLHRQDMHATSLGPNPNQSQLESPPDTPSLCVILEAIRTGSGTENSMPPAHTIYSCVASFPRRGGWTRSCDLQIYSTNLTSFESSSRVDSKYAVNPYGLLKNRSCGMVEKPHSRYSNWKPSQSSVYSYLSNCPTVASLLVGNLCFPSFPGT